jgi:hypothetical protein
MSSRELADLLLYEGGVATLAGTAFGAFGEGYIRLSYANSIENIEKALERFKETLARHAKPRGTGRAKKATVQSAAGKNGATAARARRTGGRAKAPAGANG